jgi:hypothetical protein
MAQKTDMAHTHKPTQLIANILLEDVVAHDLGAIFARALPTSSQIFLQDETHLFAKVQGTHMANSSLEGLDIAAAYVPMPVVFDAADLDRDVRSNILTQNVHTAAVTAHRSHVKIILRAPTYIHTIDTSSVAKALLTLTIAGCAGLNALAVHWQAANSVQNAQIFAGLAPYIPNLPPLSQTTLALRDILFQPDQHTLTTEGLAFHTGYEIGMDVPARLDHARIRDLLALADHFIATKPTLKNGETLAIGSDANGLSWRITERSYQNQTFMCFVPHTSTRH